MSEDDDGPNSAETEALHRLIGRGMAAGMKSEDQGALEAFLAAELPILFRDGAKAADARLLRSLLVTVSRVIWNATPLPSAGFQTRPIRAPERNEACPCGSGDKWKRCCGQFNHSFPSIPPEEAWDLLSAELEAGEAARLLEANNLPAAALAPLAAGLADAGAGQRALPLLRKALDKLKPLDERHLEALLLEVELNLEQHGPGVALPRARERALAAPREVRGRIYESLVPALADTRDLAGAWDLFAEARRETPDSSGLAYLEVMLCLEQGDLERGRERARFWLAWLRRRGMLDELPQVVELLELAVRDPQAARASLAEDRKVVAPSFMADLQALVGTATVRPVRPYAMEESDAGQSFAGAPGGIAEVERAWASLWPVAKPEGISLDVDPPRETFSQADGWLELLRREPAAFDSLSILDDLVLLVAPISVDVDPAFDAALLVPLLDRGLAIVRASLKGRDRARAPWSVALNRPALRLLLQAAYRLEAMEKTEDAAELFEWLLGLNPADDHGNRGWLVNHLLRTGDDDAALAASRQRADGLLVEAMFGEALALLRLDRALEAESALRLAIAARPLVARGLLATSLEEPVANEGGIVAGGAEEAWLYRDAMLESWSATPGALELLEGLTKATARDKRPDRPAPRRSAARAPRSRKG